MSGGPGRRLRARMGQRASGPPGHGEASPRWRRGQAQQVERDARPDQPLGVVLQAGGEAPRWGRPRGPVPRPTPAAAGAGGRGSRGSRSGCRSDGAGWPGRRAAPARRRAGGRGALAPGAPPASPGPGVASRERGGQGPGHREQPGGQALRGEHGPGRRPAPVEGRHRPAGPAQAPPGRQAQARGRLQKDGRLLIRSRQGPPGGRPAPPRRRPPPPGGRRGTGFQGARKGAGRT